MTKVYVITDGSEGQVIGVAESREVAIQFVEDYFPQDYFEGGKERQYFIEDEVYIEPFDVEKAG